MWVLRRMEAVAIVLCIFTLSLFAQGSTGSFEKDGRYVPPVPSRSFFRLAYRPDAMVGPQPFDLLHYAVDLTLSMTGADLRGTSAITLVLRSPADSLVLNAAKLALDTVRVDGALKSIGIDSVAETFTIRLQGVRTTGDTLHVKIWYRRPPGAQRPSSRQGYYFYADTIGLPASLGYTMSEPSDARFWMPCYDEPWEKATTEMNITVPRGYVAASNGRLLSTAANPDGTVTWGWKENHPIATYLMCVTASKLTISTLPFSRAVNDTVPLQYYVWAPDSLETVSYLPTVRAMVLALTGLFGPYPFDKYGMTAIVPFSYGGMEHQTITTLNRYLKTDERVVVHELAHQWWGDLVTCGRWLDVWLNESFATYSEALWRESRAGLSGLQSYMASLEHFYLGSWEGAVYDPVGQGFNLFDDVVYSKGAWALHMLRGVVGDQTFFQILSAYRQKFAGRSALTSDFQAVVDSVSGQNTAWFFDQWVYGKGWPRYTFSWLWNGDVLTCAIGQSTEGGSQTYRMPVHLRAYSHVGGTTSFVVWDSLRTQSFSLPLPFAPDSVLFDPDGWILKEYDRSEAPRDVSLRFQLHQNYPNPFNGGTSILYSIPTARHVSLRVFDVLGREVATLVDGNQSAGQYVVSFDGRAAGSKTGGLASGVYIYRLQAEDFAAVRKMLLLR